MKRAADAVASAARVTVPGSAPLGKWSHEATVLGWYPGIARHVDSS